jgi:hypothetical protein
VFNTLNVSTTGIQGLLETYCDPATSSLVLSNAAPDIRVSEGSIPYVSLPFAEDPPSSSYITMSTGQSTLKLLGVGDIQLSTIADQRAVFFSISSFTSAGYSTISGELANQISYTASTFSTNRGLASFVSSLPMATTGAYGWNWNAFYGSNIPLSTAEAYPNYTTGDVYWSTIKMSMKNWIDYIDPHSTTKIFLEITPGYIFPRQLLGSTGPEYTLTKPISSFIQYTSPTTSITHHLPESHCEMYMTSQMSNVYTSNSFTTPLKLELNAGTVLSNYAVDGNAGYYTLYHRMVGGMAELIGDGSCSYTIGRSGFSNANPKYDNRTAKQNGVYMHIYNQAAAPL